MMPEEMMIEHLEEGLAKFKLAPSKESRNKLGSTCMLLALKIGTEGKDMMDVIKEVKHREKIAGAFKEGVF